MKLKKVLALTLAAAMTLSLAGCGSSDNSADSSAASTTDDAAADTTEDTTAAEDTEAADDTADDTAAAADGLTYASITLGQDYTDLTTTIKFIHHKTDREEDGTMADLVAKFNEVYPNITVETEGVTDY